MASGERAPRHCSPPRCCWLAVLAYILVLVNESIGVTYNYDPDSTDGPQYWPGNFADFCAGARQSPISITKRRSQPINYEKMRFNNYKVRPASLKIDNNGHTVQVTVNQSPAASITGGGLPHEYELLQYHFHWGSNSMQGSEHVLEGEEFPLELHLVHVRAPLINDVATALTESEGLAVLGIFFKLGKFDNPIIEPIIDALSSVRAVDDTVTIASPFRLHDFLPMNKDNFFRYAGSLTTPLCNEAVVWTVFSDTLTISERQLTEFRLLTDTDGNPMVDNYRPLQPLNNRAIYRNGRNFSFALCTVPYICPLFENFLRTLLFFARAFV